MGEAMITRWRENRLGGRAPQDLLTGGEVARREFVSSKNLKKFLYAVRKNVFFVTAISIKTFASATSRWSKLAAGG